MVVFPGGEKISLCSIPQRRVPSESVLLFQSSPRVFDSVHEGKFVLLASMLYRIPMVSFFLKVTTAYVSKGWHAFRGIFIENKTQKK